MRLILCSSPTHIVKAHACLSQVGEDVRRPAGFLIMGTQRPELVRAIQRTAGLLFPGMPVQEAADLPSATDFDAWTAEHLVTLGNRTLASIGGGGITEIWVYCLYAASQKLLIELLTDASVIFVDDGLDSYNQQPVRDPGEGEGPEGILAAIRPKGVMRQHLARLERVFLGLAPEMGIPTYLAGLTHIQMLSEPQRQSLEAIGHHPLWGKEKRVEDKAWAIVIGSSFYRLGILSAEDEESLLRDACWALAENGYRVLYKPHPRAAISIPPLGTDFPSIAPEDTEMPLEWILLHCPVGLVVSICSTSLLTLQDMKGCRSLVLSRPLPLFRHPPPEHVGHLRGNLPHMLVPHHSRQDSVVAPEIQPWFNPQQNVQVDEVRVLYYWLRGHSHGTFLDIGGGGLRSLIPFLDQGWQVLAVPMQAATADTLQTVFAGYPRAMIDIGLVDAPRITPDAIRMLLQQQGVKDITLLKVGGLDLDEVFPWSAFLPEAVLCGFDDDMSTRTLVGTASLLTRLGYHLIISRWHPVPGKPSVWLGATPYAGDTQIPTPSKGRILAVRDPQAVPTLLKLLRCHALTTP